MLDYINNNDYINCLKISDFNTTGLTDVSSLESGKFYTLTKGSGSSEKIGTSGGSKGIGKYAAFVSSKFNTVFYSTCTVNNEEGSIGICHLCSSIKNAETGELSDVPAGGSYYCLVTNKVNGSTATNDLSGLTLENCINITVTE